MFRIHLLVEGPNLDAMTLYNTEIKFIGILKRPSEIILQFQFYLLSRMTIQEISGRFCNGPKSIYVSAYIEVRDMKQSLLHSVCGNHS
jgi:hypothetical protein